MLNLRYVYFTFITLLFSCSATQYAVKEPGLETGVSRQLATYRKSVLSDINYTLSFDVPAEKGVPIAAKEVVTFQLSANSYPLQLDFKEDSKRIKELQVNGKTVAVVHKEEHLVINHQELKKGKNTIHIQFDAGNGALNRNDEYLYTLFVPDRARTVFPCFDQPDLKATYNLTLDLPREWKAMANAGLKESISAEGKTRFIFNTSDAMSTYLFAFAAGRFELAEGMTDKMKTDFLYRETDTAKISRSIGEVFKIHDASLKYLEDWTGIPYPFQKFGFVAIPDFQFGGMEHPGTIQYKASALFLDGGATKDQINARSNLIAHETAHMWFGDLVTMDWFTDVWMKEVFANFMADKSTVAATGQDVFDLKFLVDHFPPAYGVDRTAGANPIRQDLDNLKDAGTMYGNIIYHKAPIMMRQLERLMGKDQFQIGVREYLKKFANGNASWPDLIEILDKHASADLKAWNKVWVNEPGRPVVDYQVIRKGNKIEKFVINQKAEQGEKRIWPQLFELKFYYPDGEKELTVNLNAGSVELKEAAGMEVPDFMLFNSSGQGYGVWPLDTGMFSQLSTIGKPLERATGYISLYENMLAGRGIKPLELLNLLVKNLQKEQEELNLKLISSYIQNIYWEFIPAELRVRSSAALETELWKAMETHHQANHKKLLFKAYQEVYLTAAARDNLYSIWKLQRAPAGLKLTEDDYISLAFSLALRDDKDKTILDRQLGLINNVDRRIRFEFIMPALSSDAKVRDAFFGSLEKKENRAKEANVGAALAYLHHPLRQATSIKYLPKSLELLTEIQTTGDIFFPQNWLQSTLSYYQSSEAAVIVKGFLRENANYNPKLRAKILQTADNLFKAQDLLKQ